MVVTFSKRWSKKHIKIRVEICIKICIITQIKKRNFNTKLRFFFSLRKTINSMTFSLNLLFDEKAAFILCK